MSPSRDLGRFYRLVRHVPFSQLWERVRLIGRRYWRKRFGPPRGFDRVAPAVSAHPPGPLFGPRSELVIREGDDVSIDLLNFRVRWVGSVDWHPPVSTEWTHLRRFHLHYMEFCESFTDAEFVDAVDSWIDGNPPYRGDYWYDSWSSYVVSLRAVVWMQQLAARPGLPSDFVRRAARSIVSQIRVLADHLELDIRGNHLVKNAKALVWAGTFFEGPEALTWTRVGKDLLAEILNEQILSDGMHYERSASYHAQVFADLLECVEVLPSCDLRERIVKVFPSMARALACMTHPDGGPALFNDAGLQMAYPAEQVLAVAEPYTGKVPELDGGFSLPAAGYYGFRKGGDYLLVKAGKIGPDALLAHAHADLLSFEWDVAGQRVIVDPGVSQYEAGPLRDYARGTAAHNTVTVDGTDQAEMWGAFRVGRRAEARVLEFVAESESFSLTATHDGYEHLSGGLTHWREIVLSGGTLSIQDRLEGNPAFPVEGGFLLHPDVQVEPAAGGLELRRGEIAVEADVASRTEDLPWCPGMGEVQDTTRLFLREAPGATPQKHTFRVRGRG